MYITGRLLFLTELIIYGIIIHVAKFVQFAKRCTNKLKSLSAQVITNDKSKQFTDKRN